MTRVRRRPVLEALTALGLGLAIPTLLTTDWDAATQPLFCHSTPDCRIMFDVDGTGATVTMATPTEASPDADSSGAGASRG